MPSPARLAVLLTILLCAASRSVAAQVIRGTTIEAATGTPIADVGVSVLDGEGRERAVAVTDSAGRFRLALPGPGTYTLRAVHIAYDSVVSGLIGVDFDALLEAEVRMGLRPVELEPVTVTVRQAASRRFLREYYERAERNRKMGIGRILTRADLEGMAGMTADDVLRRQPFVSGIPGQFGMRGVQFQRRGAGCIPAVFINGMPGMGEDLGIPASDIEGIEIYRGPAHLPVEYMHAAGSCGVILVWLRPGNESDRPFSFKRLLVGLGAMAALLFVF